MVVLGSAFFTRLPSIRGRIGVPFYLDTTLGGSNINGTILLPSYADYRFRGPDPMLLRGTFEHSIGKFPVGVKLMLDEGRVGLKAQRPRVLSSSPQLCRRA